MWGSTRMSQENIKNSHTSDTTFSPKLYNKYTFDRVEFKGICLRQDSVSFLHKKVVNLYISYKLDTWSKDSNKDFTLGICLFGAVKLTKNADPDKYKYSSYGTGFDSCSQFSWIDRSLGKNVIIFGVHNSSSVYIDGRIRNIFVLGERPKQGLDIATITAEAKYHVHFTESGK